MKTLKYTVTLILITLTGQTAYSQLKADLSNIQNVEIFLFNVDCRNQNSYSSFKTKEEEKAFLDKYQSTEQIPSEECAYYIDFNKCNVQDEPFLNKKQIERFDWKLSEIHLTSNGLETLMSLDIPTNGRAFIIKVNNKVIYGGWFWNTASSEGSDRVWTFQKPKDKVLKLQFGLGGFKCGTDPRTDETLIIDALKN